MESNLAGLSVCATSIGRGCSSWGQGKNCFSSECFAWNFVTRQHVTLLKIHPTDNSVVLPAWSPAFYNSGLRICQKLWPFFSEMDNAQWKQCLTPMFVRTTCGFLLWRSWSDVWCGGNAQDSREVLGTFQKLAFLPAWDLGLTKNFLRNETGGSRFIRRNKTEEKSSN